MHLLELRNYKEKKRNYISRIKINLSSKPVKYIKKKENFWHYKNFNFYLFWFKYVYVK